MSIPSSKYSKKIKELLENTADLSLKRKAKSILTTLNPKKGEKILEVGCGNGYYLLMINQLGVFHSIGLDYDPKTLEEAEINFQRLEISYERLKKWQEGLPEGVYFIQGDVAKMPFKTNYFDKVIMSEVAEHLQDDLKGLKEVYRCLKSDGLLLLTVPNHNYPFLWDPINWIFERVFKTHIKSGFWAGIWNQHVKLYYPDQIKNVMEKAGFKIRKIEVQTKWCLPFNHYLINLGARILAAKVLPEKILSQVNKFEKFNPKERSSLIKLYFGLAEFADSYNKNKKTEVGTTIFVEAYK